MNALAPLLTKREREVIEGLCGGLNGVQIAESLRIAHATVSNHRANMLLKLHCKTQAEAAAKWTRGYFMDDVEALLGD